MKSISNEEYTISIEDKINDVEIMMSDKMESINKSITSYTIHQNNHNIINIVNKEIDKALRIEYSNEDSISLVYNECFDKTYLIVYGKVTKTLYFNITNMNDKCILFKIKDKISGCTLFESSALIFNIVNLLIVIGIFIVFKSTIYNILDIIDNEMNELINQIKQLEQMN